MRKGSGNSQRHGISLEASGVKINAGHLNEINTTFNLRRVEHRWFTKDEQVVFGKRKEGWVIFSFSYLVRKVFNEYGLISQQTGTVDYEPTCFPSLKVARQAVNDVSLEAGLNIDSRLTRGKAISYKIGGLPLIIKREEDAHWWVGLHLVYLSQSLQKHFNTTEEFLAAWESADIRLAHYPTRKAGHQAVINWLSQTIIEGK
jgi:hypothetical protein